MNSIHPGAHVPACNNGYYTIDALLGIREAGLCPENFILGDHQDIESSHSNSGQRRMPTNKHKTAGSYIFFLIIVFSKPFSLFFVSLY